MSQESVIENFVYDDRGSLSIFETDMAGRMTNGAYEYDILGRLTHKVEAGSDIIFDYVDGSYRPVSVSVNGQEIDRALAFDQAGNLWLNGVSNVAYKLNGAGLPEKALRYVEALPAGISLEQVDAGNVATAENVVAYEYDGSARVYERRHVNGEFVSGRVTVPGLGSYTRGPETGFSIERLDLPGGGYRTGADGAALFPLTDAQGSIRGYANLSGVRSAHAYYPYGSVEDLSNDAPEDARRWQSKEFDGEHGKYYFGARFYDPFFGLWISPDPAGQFANPYSYGGDPLNYVDPSGMWAVGAGLVVGWDQQHGWNFGVGVGDAFTFMFNQDGSSSLNVGTSAQIAIQTSVYIEFGFTLGYSMNTYSGSNVSTSASVCVGEVGNCVGVENGYNFSWDRSGRFGGATTYLELYAQFGGGLARVSTGYEAGLFGAEGRGLYAGGTFAGIHGELTRLEEGLDSRSSWGVQERLYFGVGDTHGEESANGKQKNVHLEFFIPSLGNFGHLKIGDTYDVSHKGLAKALKKALLELGIEDLTNFINAEGLFEEGENGKIKNPTLDQYETIKTIAKKAGVTVKESVSCDGSFKYDKDQFIASGSAGYPGIEFKYDQKKPEGTRAFSSYNYGRSRFTHFLIDFLGYFYSPNPK